MGRGDVFEERGPFRHLVVTEPENVEKKRSESGQSWAALRPTLALVFALCQLLAAVHSTSASLACKCNRSP